MDINYYEDIKDRTDGDPFSEVINRYSKVSQ